MKLDKKKVHLHGNLDGGLSWFIVLASFMTQFVVMGIHNVFGLLYIDLLEEFGKSKAATAGVASISFGLTFFCAPLSCLLIKKVGCRVVAITGGVLCGLALLLSSFVDSIYRMYVTYSFLFGVGCSMCYCSSILVLSNYFSKYLVVANGIGLSGAGVGTVTLAPALSLLLDSYYWRFALRMLSVTCLILVISGIIYFLVPVPMELVDAEEYKEDKSLFDLSVLKNKAFVVWICATTLVMFGYYIPYVHLLHHGQEFGIRKQDGAALVGYMAMCQTFGKIVFGRIADHPGVNRLYLCQMCLLVCSVLTTLLPVFTTYESLLAFCLLFGFHDGCVVVLIAVLTVDIAGRKSRTSALGIMYSLNSISMMLGPLVAGWIYPVIQSYEPAFFMSGAFTTLGVCLLFLVPLVLSPVIANEWHVHSKNFRERILSSTSSDATKSWTLDSGSSNVDSESISGVSRNTKKESANVLLDKDVVEDNIKKREDIDFNFENQFLMLKLVGEQDCILGSFHDCSKDIWIHISDPRRETWV